MGSPASVRVDNDLAPSETCICSGAAHIELTRGVNDDLSVAEHVLGDDLLDDLLSEGFPDGLVGDFRVVLR